MTKIFKSLLIPATLVLLTACSGEFTPISIVDESKIDTDNDGITNNIDTDDDNDGVPDNEDSFPLDDTKSDEDEDSNPGENDNSSPAEDESNSITAANGVISNFYVKTQIQNEPGVPDNTGHFIDADVHILGADISSLKELTDSGAVFVDTDGEEKPFLSLLKNHGFNYIRLRTFVEPDNQYGYASGDGTWCHAKAEPYNDKAHIIEMAKMVKDFGMKLLLDFHYSDTWADPAKQVIPQAWRGINTIEVLAAQVKSYTVEVLTDMKAAGVVPDMVQVGNEITHGMLAHVPTASTDCYGNNSVSTSSVSGSTSNWSNLSKLLKAGIEGVKQVNEDSLIMLHVENTASSSSVTNWVNQAQRYGVDFDVLGLSAYEKWHGPTSNWEGTLNTLANTFPELDFSFVEYNPQAQLVNDIMHELPNGQGLGTFFWEPLRSGEWGASIFSQRGNVYTAMPDAFLLYDNMINKYQ